MSEITGLYSLFLVALLLLGYSFLKWRWEREALRQQNLGAATFTAYLIHRLLFCPNPSIRGEFSDPESSGPDQCHPGCPHCTAKANRVIETPLSVAYNNTQQNHQ